MSVSFRRGVRENVGLWINLIAGTGGGKTYTGMRLASGILKAMIAAGVVKADQRFAVIDTENRRALHYADQFQFDHAELRPPFRPEACADAVVAADAAGYPVILIDSGSHVWAGDGGVLDWQEEELDAMVKRASDRKDSRPEWQIREAGKMSAWIKPKMGHKQMVQKLLQVRAHIILCLRAEEKIEMVREKDGNREKTVIRPKQSLTGKDGWIPICDKNLPFEATCSFLLLAGNPGIPHPIKLQEQHKAIFPPDKLIDESSGQRLAEWAAGTKTPKAEASSGASAGPAGTPPAGGAFITPDQATALEARCNENVIPVANLRKAAGVERLAMIRAEDLKRAEDWITAAIEKRKQQEQTA